MKKQLKLLAVASGGGHWVQLLRLLPAFENTETVFVSTLKTSAQVQGNRYYRVHDCSRTTMFGVILVALEVFSILMKERPDVIISTGAAPGYLAIRLGRLFKARTIWVDSFANVDELSLSGRLAGKQADLWLTQWPHLASPDGPGFAGTVI